jgi:quaternary ammonium compound-resistance protein SugE
VVIAGLFEIAWAVGLKQSEGFSKPLPTVLTIAALIISFVLLALGLRTLPVGTAYAVWTGIGAAGTVIVGMLLFNEPVEVLRLVCIGLIIAGVIGLRLVSPE